MARLSIEEKIRAVKILSDPDRPLQRIINARDPRRHDGPATEYDSKTLLEGSSKIAEESASRYARVAKKLSE